MHHSGGARVGRNTAYDASPSAVVNRGPTRLRARLRWWGETSVGARTRCVGQRAFRALASGLKSAPPASNDGVREASQPERTTPFASGAFPHGRNAVRSGAA